jgi:Flp pilus assembly pilin Flp
MLRTCSELLFDETGFIVSAELVLIATLLVIGLVVGLSEVQHAVVQELNDVAEAIGALNQSYAFAGFRSMKFGGGLKSFFAGSFFHDSRDDCDGNECDITCAPPDREGKKHSH